VTAADDDRDPVNLLDSDLIRKTIEQVFGDDL
jgi:hypothetical protein